MSLLKLLDASGKSMNVVDTGDFILPVGAFDPRPESAKKNFEYIPHFKLREDDVMLLTYPKTGVENARDLRTLFLMEVLVDFGLEFITDFFPISECFAGVTYTGTNWMYEILLMLLKKSAEPLKSSKIETMLEFVTQEAVDKIPSPRVIDTHVPYRYLPKDLKEKKIKTVLCVRNPKDMLVSYYNHVKGLKHYEYTGEWKDWFQHYMNGRVEYGMYTDYLKEFEAAMAEGIGYPLHLVHNEDLKLNCLEEVKKLAKFLDVDANEELLKNIVQNCSFDTMTKTKKFPVEMEKVFFTEGFQFFRKGQVGDWQNWFTAAESEQFDSFWEKEMADSKIKFTYTQNKTRSN